MSKTPNYYIVEADALPEIFRKVVEARRMLDTGGGRNGQPGGPAHGDQPQRVLQISGRGPALPGYAPWPDRHLSNHDEG